MTETPPHSTTDENRTAHPEEILLVEDNPSDARLIEEYVRELSWPDVDDPPTIRHVDRLESAVDARDDDVDVVLLDLGLPDSNGIETLERMLDAAGDEPVVVLTGLDDQRAGIEAVERGAQDYLVKDDLTPGLLGKTLQYAVERERQQRELRQRNEELTLLNRIVRHDIQNDVAIILGWGGTLREHVDPTGEEYLDRMTGAGEHITNITETVGDFLEILEGKEEPDLQPIDLGSLLRAEVEKARTAHREAAITLREDFPDDLRVSGTELLSSVFRNLVNNAVVHNDAETPEVLIDVTAGGETVEVHVIDNGPGVPDSQKDEVFGRGEMGLESPGSGIGLYLVDTLVDTYDGDVRIEDRGQATLGEGGTDGNADGPPTGRGDGDESGSVFVVTLQRA